MRPKEFHANRVLEKCISLFWNGGFKATSFDNIHAATDVNRASLYNEFVSKEGLLAASLDLYFERYIQPKLTGLEQAPDFFSGLQNFYKSFFTAAPGNATSNGCYTIAISTEMGRELEAVNQRLRTLLEALEHAIRTAAQKANHSLSETSIELLVGLFCSSAGICLVMSEPEIDFYLQSNLKLTLNAETAESIR